MPKEYIEKEPLLQKAKELQGELYAAPLILRAIENAPTADVAEVKHGKWIKDRNRYICSKCGFYYFANNSKANYCSNCGAKMDKE